MWQRMQEGTCEAMRCMLHCTQQTKHSKLNTLFVGSCNTQQASGVRSCLCIGVATLSAGSSGDHVFLWSFKEHESIQAYVPLIEPNTAAAHAARGAAGGGGRGGGGGAAGGHGFGLEEGSAALALAHAAPSRKHLLLQLLQSPHWDGAVRAHTHTHTCARTHTHTHTYTLWKPQVLAPDVNRTHALCYVCNVVVCVRLCFTCRRVCATHPMVTVSRVWVCQV